jgi:hypothetical protein
MARSSRSSMALKVISLTRFLISLTADPFKVDLSGQKIFEGIVVQGIQVVGRSNATDKVKG